MDQTSNPGDGKGAGRLIRAGRWPWAATALPYTTLLALRYGAAVLRAQRLMDERWEQLVETYPDRLEDLEVAFGHHLRTRYPEVRAAHHRGRLEFVGSEGAGQHLVMELGEPLRTPFGWGGLRLEAMRDGVAVPLPASELFLTLLRGTDPEWMARSGGPLVHRLIVADERFVVGVAQKTFG